MTELQRLLRANSPPLEQELLRAAAGEPVPAELERRMAATLALTLGELTSGSLDASGTPAPSAHPPPGAPGPTLGEAAAKGGDAAASAALKSTSLSAAWIKGAGALALTGAVAAGFAWRSPRATPATVSVSAKATAAAVRTPLPPDPELAKPAATQEPSVEAEALGGESPARQKHSLRQPRAAGTAETAAAHALPPEPARQAAASDAPATHASAPRTGDVGAELHMLDNARRAITGGHLTTARQQLADYQARFPNGILRAEADALAHAVARASANASRPVASDREQPE